MENDRKETEHQVDKDGSVSPSTALLAGGICNVEKEQLERKLHVVHLASFSPKDVKLIRGSHAPIQHIRDSDLCLLEFFFFQHTEMRLFPLKKKTHLVE